ncbi:hypothetical protein [Micromonospora echinofusca]|uniref:Thioesterase domain-containing protein n=1 Tax=Micromonospora echinofusca TaxID=47858 RepID=A0A1C5GC05_MICEH|nr:hypothetical protein GA0070610_3386 [Micromonospora echinofusca]
MQTQSAPVTTLRDGRHGVVVAVDFGGVREEAGFPDLLPFLTIEHTVLVPQTTVEIDADWEGMRQHQLRSWLDSIRSYGQRVSAVLGYCAGSAMATRLAIELADAAGGPALVLLDPSWPTREVLLEAHEVAVERLLDSVRDPAVRQSLRAPVPDEADPTRLARALVTHYSETAWRVAAQLGLTETPVRKLITRIEQHLSYLLVAAGEAADVATRDLLPPAGSVLTILSVATPGEVAWMPGTTVRTELPRPRLLADPAVASRVEEFIRRHDADSSGAGTSATPDGPAAVVRST